MKEFIPILNKTRLFSGLSEDEIIPLLSCLGAKKSEYKKGEYVFRQGDKIRYITLLLSGEIHIQRDDYWGNRTIISRITSGEMFGEAYIAPDGGPILNDAVAVLDSTVFFGF